MSNVTSSFPAPVYREQVLAHIFADAQHLFLPSLLEIDRAHAVMLHRSGIITRDTAAACLQGINALNLEELRSTIYDGSVEDLFFLVEKKLADIAGQEHAGRLHTARSRNDIDLTMYRMVLRSNLLNILGASLKLRSVLLTIATQYRDALMPAYTHNQPAQPTTLGHYMMAMAEVLERDAERLIACFARVNRNPLGACAITTTGFPIQRDLTMRLLGFNGLVVNSYGAIAAVDYVAEACSVLATAMLSLGRFTQDMLLWSTAEFNFLRLSNGYVQISSIMPQKRNPVPLEHVRILSSRALTESQSVLSSLHNTPFADMNDGEDSLQPLVALAFSDAQRALTLIAGALSEATFNTEEMRRRAGGNFLPVTEVADTLVRQTGISFHDAHTITSAAVRSATSDDVSVFVDDLFRRTQEAKLNITKQQLRQAMDPEHFVAIRTITGGPASSAMQAQIDHASQQLQVDEQWLAATRANLEKAKTLLQRECELITQSHR
ncbi:argininosuccinate lyase [Terriglobus roseus]|uniref:Argininosuccinate lyase n=1 Tax=Terriglobus roseus TaxID=392734 RepID=A0A1G7GWI1_9BACT|nr:argininosuccinate lyase [Terriglobus roseus]SDE92434.1 argininosuccinate lyase [Terriglobus roseus]